MRRKLIQRLVLRMTDAFKKGDLILLLLCIVATAFGCLMIASTTSATASATGAAYRMPWIPLPLCMLSINAGSRMAKGVKHRISRTKEATTARMDLPMDWKNTAVILVRQVMVISAR